MDQRREFVRLALSGRVPVRDLCRCFGISADTGYRLLNRFKESGDEGLEDRSRRPQTSPNRTSPQMEAAVLSLREQHPAWGGRKLARRLKDLGLIDVPSPSTVVEILRRNNRLSPQGGRNGKAFTKFERAAPNELWQMDFKGHFATKTGRCHPLTVLDDHSRYALGLRACEQETRQTTGKHLVSIFRIYGLPDAILCDNGGPWGTTGSGATYSRLGVWLLQLGIQVLHGRPRHPQTQGKDERFHRTLDVEVLQYNCFQGLDDCQRTFDRWRTVYNFERPHHSLNYATPSKKYQPSARRFPEKIPEPEYYETDVIRKVRPDGYISFKGKKVSISQAFAGHQVALRESTDDGLWDVFFARFPVAQINLRDREI